jgi:probable F420-dependent oxidoreductase
MHIPLPGDGNTAAFARKAEACGLDYVSCGEHVLFATPTPSAFVSLAVAAAVTTRIGVLSSIVLLPLYPAAIVAKMAAVLDVESGGRFSLGIGAGGDYPKEFEACGVPMTERSSRTDEALEVVRALWTGKPVTFEGRHNRLSDVILNPVPQQRPGVPIWVAGRKERAKRRAARFGDYWFPYMYTPDMLSNSLLSIREYALEAGRPANSVKGAMFLYLTSYPDSEYARKVAVETVGGIYSQNFDSLAGRYLVYGNPADCRRRLREYRDAGADAFIFLLACPPGDVLPMLERCSEDIFPEFRS